VSEGSGKSDRHHEGLLIDRIRQGDGCAMRELIDLHKDRLYAFIRRMIHNHHDAEEICQDAFLRAFSSLDSFSAKYRFSTWLFTIGYRVCLNWLRRKRPMTGELDFTTLPLSVPDAPTVSLESEEVGKLKNLVWSAVDRLSTPQRATVLLFYRHGESCNGIAQVLGLPVATVKSHLHRARTQLRSMLEPVVAQQDLTEFRNLAG